MARHGLGCPGPTSGLSFHVPDPARRLLGNQSLSGPPCCPLISAGNRGVLGAEDVRRRAVWAPRQGVQGLRRGEKSWHWGMEGRGRTRGWAHQPASSGLQLQGA